MEEVIRYLENSQLQYLSTIGIDGKPKVRPFQFMFEQEGKLWFCTSNKKEVYKELAQLPFIELCASDEKMSWLRLEAKVIFEDNLKIKQKVFECSSLVKGIYKEITNPDFEVFFLSDVQASVSMIGKPAIRYSL